MTLYRIEAHRTQKAVIYVEAASREEADEDAEVLIDGFSEWQEDFDDIDAAVEVGSLPPGESYWTGGPDGEWSAGWP